jgi:hypothetical protein
MCGGEEIGGCVAEEIWPSEDGCSSKLYIKIHILPHRRHRLCPLLRPAD